MPPSAMAHDAPDADAGTRFAFGRNWARFLSDLNDTRIARAEASLREMLGTADLNGATFLDVGSGSGLFSLAARRLGARVRSFDYDPESVACTAELRRRFFPDDPAWEVSRGDALDADFLRSLGTFDIVYSWGVLHHTGDMWRALDNVVACVRPGGRLFVALYNDQGAKSRVWLGLKRLYNRLPEMLRPAYTVAVMGPREAADGLYCLLRGRFGAFLRRWTDPGGSNPRGMSRVRDIVDWIGGYPFEVARPDDVVAFYAARGFVPVTTRTVGRGSGCNEFVFVRGAAEAT
jgi:SAM-dependent methyltransferase